MRRLSWFALAAFAIACNESGSGATGPGASINGTYALSTIGGSPPPFVLVATPDHTLRITTGNLVMGTTNTFSTTTTFEELETDQTTTTTETCTGTYTRTGNGLLFSEAVSGETCGGTFPGSWDGGDNIAVEYHASRLLVYTR
jgi:hypothetical protein